MNKILSVSVIMQVSMLNYSNSKISLEYKFNRAVNSFIAQTYKNCELIIVSDGCRRTEEIYLVNFKHIKNIRFIYYDKKQNELSHVLKNESGNRIYRGYPRNIGIGASTNDIITYLDADDVLLPEHIETLVNVFNKSPETDWILNTSYFFPLTPEYLVSTDPNWAIELPNLSGKWLSSWCDDNPKNFSLSVFLVSHKNGLDVKWKDTVDDSDDSTFIKSLMEKFPNWRDFLSPTYVYCHDYLGRFDV